MDRRYREMRSDDGALASRRRVDQSNALVSRYMSEARQANRAMLSTRNDPKGFRSAGEGIDPSALRGAETRDKAAVFRDSGSGSFLAQGKGPPPSAGGGNFF